MRADIAPGGIFPDYELTDHTKTLRSLSELQGDDPLILVLAPGHYCPKDHQQHLELAAAYPKIAVAYTQIVTISTDNTLETREFRVSVGAQWTFLSDAGRKLQKDLDIQEHRLGIDRRRRPEGGPAGGARGRAPSARGRDTVQPRARPSRVHESVACARRRAGAEAARVCRDSRFWGRGGSC